MRHAPTSQNRLRMTTMVVALSTATAVIGLPGASGRFGIPIAAAADDKPNACGCYRDSAGSCYCGKKAKCGCPGECEPKGCEEKRDKLIKKEIEVETRKAQEQSRKHAETKSHDDRPVAEPEESRPSPPPPKSKPKRPTPKMSAPQRKEFLRLLDIYVAEDPGHRGQTIEQVRDSVKSAR
jgi:hypothetical protein